MDCSSSKRPIDTEIHTSDDGSENPPSEHSLVGQLQRQRGKNVFKQDSNEGYVDSQDKVERAQTVVRDEVRCLSTRTTELNIS